MKANIFTIVVVEIIYSVSIISSICDTKALEHEIFSLKQEHLELKNEIEQIQKTLESVSQGKASHEKKKEEWLQFGVDILSASKRSFKNQRSRLIVRVSSNKTFVSFWRVNGTYLEVDNIHHGTRKEHNGNNTTFTIEFDSNTKDCQLVLLSKNQFVSVSLNADSGDLTETYPPQQCRFSQPKHILKDKTFNLDARFQCNSHFGVDRSAYIYLDYYISEKSSHSLKYSRLVNNTPNISATHTHDRNSTLKVDVNVSKEWLSDQFILIDFLLSNTHVGNVIDITYSFMDPFSLSGDISFKRGDFRIVQLFPLPLIKGNRNSIFCKAIGNLPPPLRLEKDGKPVLQALGRNMYSGRTSAYSFVYITIDKASEDDNGNYTCTGQSDGIVRSVSFPVRIQLKERLLSAKIINHNTSELHILVVFEGYEEVSLWCYIADSDQDLLAFSVSEATEKVYQNKWIIRKKVVMSFDSAEVRSFKKPLLMCSVYDMFGGEQKTTDLQQMPGWLWKDL